MSVVRAAVYQESHARWEVHLHSTTKSTKKHSNDKFLTGSFSLKQPRVVLNFRFNNSLPHSVPRIIQMKAIGIEILYIRNTPTSVNRPGFERRLLRAKQCETIDVHHSIASVMLSNGPLQSIIQFRVFLATCMIIGQPRLEFRTEKYHPRFMSLIWVDRWEHSIEYGTERFGYTFNCYSGSDVVLSRAAYEQTITIATIFILHFPLVDLLWQVHETCATFSIVVD